MIDIVEEHFEEIDFLLEQRERIVVSLERTAADLASLDWRLCAHVDALVVAAESAVDVVEPHLRSDERSAVAAATFALVSISGGRFARSIVDVLRTADDWTLRHAVRVGLRHAPVDPMADALYELALDGDARTRAVAGDVLAFHRMRPPPEFRILVGDDDPTVRSLALAAGSRFGSGLLLMSDVQKASTSENEALRRVALESGARAGLDVLSLCRTMSAGAGAVPEAVRLLGALGGEKDFESLQGLLRFDDLAGDALAAIGALGDFRGIALAIDCMGMPSLADQAGSAFVRMTGLRNVFVNEPASDPEGEPSRRPDASLARAEWERFQSRAPREGRLQAGVAVSGMTLAQMDGISLASRQDAYLRSRGTPGGPDVETEALMARQRRELEPPSTAARLETRSR